MVLSKEGLDMIYEFSLSETNGCEAAVQFLNLSDYSYEGMYLELDQIVDAAYRLCHNAEENSKELVESMHAHWYDY